MQPRPEARSILAIGILPEGEILDVCRNGFAGGLVGDAAPDPDTALQLGVDADRSQALSGRNVQLDLQVRFALRPRDIDHAALAPRHSNQSIASVLVGGGANEGATVQVVVGELPAGDEGAGEGLPGVFVTDD